MKSMVVFSVIYTVLFAPTCHTLKRELRPLDDFSFKSFLAAFRESMLAEVARQWNVTIAQAQFLQKQMTTCNAKIQTRVDACRNCTQIRCTDQPNFDGYVSAFDPLSSLKGPLEELGAGMSEAVVLLGTRSFTFLQSVEGIASEAGKSFGAGFQSVTNEVIKDFQKLPDVLQQGGQLALDGLTDAGNHALDGLKDLGNQALGGITDFGNTVGNGIKNAGQSAIDKITSLFGRRRRMYDVSSHDCMERCDDVCLQLMTDDNDRVITDVCGAFVVSLNKTVHRSIVKTTTVYNATLDTTMPILTKVEIDTSDLDTSTMEINTFYITVNIGGHYVRFRSSEAYRMVDVMGTARLVAAEVWQMWT